MIRAAVCERLAGLGVTLDPEANAAGAIHISTTDGEIAVPAYATDEEAVIAQHTHAMLSRELATVRG